MQYSDLYAGYTLPLRVAITGVSLSHPENFIKRTTDDWEQTSLGDKNGSWLSLGTGGSTNTIDLSLQLIDATGRSVDQSDVLPIKVVLWLCKDGVLHSPRDFVSVANNPDSKGNRNGTHSALVVTGKPGTGLCINHSGTGTLSLRVVTTSQLNNRMKFSFEVAPDCEQSPAIEARLRYLFEDHTCSDGDVALSNRSLSPPIDVMTKINRPKRRRESGAYESVKRHLRMALEKLGAAQTPLCRDPVLFGSIVEQCELIQGALEAKAESKIVPLPVPRQMELRQREFSLSWGSIGSLGLNDVAPTDDKENNKMSLRKQSSINSLYDSALTTRPLNALSF